jgi:hypothetical protein
VLQTCYASAGAGSRRVASPRGDSWAQTDEIASRSESAVRASESTIAQLR